jgi:hypothetical protein
LESQQQLQHVHTLAALSSGIVSGVTAREQGDQMRL